MRVTHCEGSPQSLCCWGRGSGTGAASVDSHSQYDKSDYSEDRGSLVPYTSGPNSLSWGHAFYIVLTTNYLCTCK